MRATVPWVGEKPAEDKHRAGGEQNKLSALSAVPPEFSGGLVVRNLRTAIRTSDTNVAVRASQAHAPSRP